MKAGNPGVTVGRTTAGCLLVAGVLAAGLLAPVPAGAASEPNWTQVGSYQPPIVRAAHAMAREPSGRVVLFGGIAPVTPAVQDDTWRFDGSRWQELHPDVSPPPREHAMTAYDAAREELVLFGGGSGLNDTWTWDGTAWTEQSPELSPPPRAAGGMAYDPATEKVILFGGVTSTNVPLADTWSWDGTAWEPEPTLLSPPPRFRFGFADGGAASKPVLFGGRESLMRVVYYADTWVWDGPARTWTLAAVTGPSGRAEVNMAFDPANDVTLLHGGKTGNPLGQQPVADTWSWDGSAWTQLNPPTSPSFTTRARAGLAFDAVDQKLRLFGGESCTPVGVGGSCIGNWANDTWAWDGTTWEQEDLTAPGLLQKPVFAREPLLDPEAEDPEPTWVAFSGQTRYGNYSTETWRWDGAEWERLSPERSPPPRLAGAMVFDQARNQTLLFGGLVDTLVLPGERQMYRASDTWVWDGSGWTELAPETSPPQRYEASIAYDAARGEVVLFGGFNEAGPLSDTWVWDGATWTERHPAAGPAERFGAQMTYDPVRGEVVLFGGSMAANADWYSDTWVWDGEHWTEILTPSSPGKRAYGVLAFDPSTESSILFGGCAGCYANPTFDETWSWDGARWTQLQPSRSPERRTSLTAVSGDEIGPMLLFSGRRAVLTPEGGMASYPEGTGYTNDVWQFGS